jgi:hypothetical protein
MSRLGETRIAATSGHTFCAADRLGKSKHANGGGGAARAATRGQVGTEAAEQTSTEGGEGKRGAGKEGSTRGDEDGDEGRSLLQQRVLVFCFAHFAGVRFRRTYGYIIENKFYVQISSAQCI